MAYDVEATASVDRERVQSLFDLHDRVAVVTGGTRGIGRAVAEGLVAAGAKVVVASRRPEACAATEAALVEMGGEALGVPTHLGELDALERLVERSVERFGRLDIVVNNAATALTAPIADLTPEAWDKAYSVNLRGPVFLARAALPHLSASPCAAVLNVVSVGAFSFAPGLAMYAGAKAALLAFTRNMAAEWAPLRIRVNALAPGSVDTDMMRNNTEEAQARMAASSLQQRMAQPHEMIGPALFLVSDAASFVTGQVVIADGGLTAGR